MSLSRPKRSSRTKPVRRGIPAKNGTSADFHDHNTLKLSLRIEDPKMYTKPFSLGSFNYKWVPNQKINEWLCLPSEQLKYLEEQGDPAGAFPDPAERRGGRGR